MTALNELRLSERLRRLTGWAGFALVVFGIISGISTFAILTGLTPVRPTAEITTILLVFNAVLLLVMTVMVLGQVLFLFMEQRQGTAGAGLHLRFVALFSLIAITPAIVVAAFASVTLNRGLDAWFSQRTQAIVEGAVKVAEAYVKDHSEATRNDVAAIAGDITQQKTLFDTDRGAFVRRMARHAAIRGLPALFIFSQNAKRLDANVTANDTIQFVAPQPAWVEKAAKGELVIIPPGQGGNIVRALFKLQGYSDEYLYIYKPINGTVIDQLLATQAAKNEYDQLQAQRTGVQLTFAMMYGVVAFVFLLAAIWIGLWFSNRLVAPLVKLLDAARRVSTGDLEAKVDAIESPGDLATLARTFNLMTGHIKEQRDQLINTNETLDTRRRFTEAMLEGVSAGVIGINPEGKVSLVNRSALGFLGYKESDLIGKAAEDVLSAFRPLFELSLSRPSGFAEGQVDMNVKGIDRAFFARFTTEASDTEAHGHVLTFDDITDLVSAQRNSAWADIARRIAHEIKNPLTPIQLSAERLKRKYGGQIHTDKQIFDQCTDTIIRQVGDIGRMVDEFSSFARMPKAVPEPQQLADVVREATVLQRVSSSDIDIDVDVKDAEFVFAFDRRLITQAVTNLVKNAREAIEGRQQNQPEPRGMVRVEAGHGPNGPFVRVTDNGVGLPKENRHRLAEPYMTTREKGTGLGLAIVKRIMEEHGGRLMLEDAPADFAGGLGARVTLQFAALEEPAAQTA
jgi:two-component system, NtrC family, nitrogen regulation sensor histidine kinase NtrY